jgi:hypothetical protein
MIKNQIKNIVTAELTKNKDTTKKELIEKINKFLEVEAIDTLVEKEDIM